MEIEKPIKKINILGKLTRCRKARQSNNNSSCNRKEKETNTSNQGEKHEEETIHIN